MNKVSFRVWIFHFIVFLIAILSCNQDNPINEPETVSTPSIPSGSSSGQVNESLTYSTGGANSNFGHSIEYRFDWDDGNYSNWSSSASASHSWSTDGTKYIQAQARCAIHNGIVSSWSSSKSVIISSASHTVSTPDRPNGPDSGFVDQSLTYSTGGASCNLGHSIQYRFDWDDGTYSNWASSINVIHSWSTTGTKYIRAQARCASNTNIVSSWSNSRPVVIVNSSISLLLVGSYNTPDWAWDVAVSGNYAYVADDESGIQIINISNIAEPFLVGTYVNVRTFDVAEQEGYLYVPAFYDGLKIIRVWNPSDPILWASYGMGDMSDVYVDGSYAYLACNTALPALTIINVSDPSSPCWVGGDNSPDSASCVFASTGYVYLTNLGGELYIYNVIDPANPILVTIYETGYTYTEEVFVLDGNAYIAGWNSGGGGGVTIIDIHNPDNPIMVGECASTTGAAGVTVFGNYVYVAEGIDGVEVFDVSDPTQPESVASYAVPHLACRIAVANGYIFVASGVSGLLILRLEQ